MKSDVYNLINRLNYISRLSYSPIHKTMNEMYIILKWAVVHNEYFFLVPFPKMSFDVGYTVNLQ